MRIDVIIPTYKPDARLLEIIGKLRAQSVAPDRIVLINTEKSYLDALFSQNGLIAPNPGVEVINITEEQFDHGATRNEGAKGSEADCLLFMTMDATPADDKMIENMAEHFSDDKVAAVYARQLPYENASLGERFSRSFNYPDRSCVKTIADKERLGIKTFFCSNACAMYDRKVFEKLGGFPEGMIFNEDMVFARRVIENGYAIAYAASAGVYHSHNYTNMQQFHRNFDLAVSQAMHPEAFADVSSESEGKTYVKTAFVYFLKAGRPLYFIPFAIQSAFRLAGYRLGKRYDTLSRARILKYTSNPNFFKKYWS